MSIHYPSLTQWHRGLSYSNRWPAIAGLMLLLVCGVGFGAWAALAPLEGAVVASGSFVATGQNKQIQHLEGGILRDVLVKEGDLVEAGQTLIRMDETTAKAKLRRLVIRQYRLLISRARLEAEINEKDAIDYPPALIPSKDAFDVSSVMSRQIIELRARRMKLTAEQDVFRKEIAGLQESIRGYTAQVKSTQQRVSLFQEELRDKNSLFERQLIRKTDILTLQRAEAGLSGELGELLGRIADSREKMARADQQIASLRSSTLQKAVEELRETETELDDVEEQIGAASDVLARVDVKAPVRGIVVRLNHHTQRGVISPGAVILELLPVDEELVIEARVSPSEITHVTEGQSAFIRLSALNQRLTPMISGAVTYLSADTVSEQETPGARPQQSSAQKNSFIVRVKLDQADLKQKVSNFRPTPGMPADIFIKTTERTFFDYLMQPVSDSFARAFREQ